MSQSPRDSQEDENAMRVGGVAAGLLAGLAIGVVSAALLLAVGSEVLAGWAFFACTAGGAVVGYLSAAAGLGLAEGVSHFIVGLVHGMAERVSSPSAQLPWWLRWLFFAGVLVGLLILVTRRW
jgi:hypothetical protein